ncbi:hypothetical protein SESBI_12893 [Sesbania bispinosa]|nr:hypothetical protein SESBI_12893 [Sesbania bispinosa]
MVDGGVRLLLHVIVVIHIKKVEDDGKGEDGGGEYGVCGGKRVIREYGKEVVKGDKVDGDDGVGG